MRARLTPSGATGRAGTVVATPASVRWRSRLGLRRVDLTGARVLGSADRDGDVALHLALPDRSTAELQLSRADVAAVERSLTGGTTLAGSAEEPSAGRRVPRGWGAIAAVAVGGLWMLFVGCMFVTGYRATVTVTGGAGDGFCDVVWEDPAGQPRSGESDCYDEPAGSSFEVRVSGWPAAGEPTLVETYAGIGLLFGLPPFLLGGGRLLQLARRRRRELHDGTSTAPHARGVVADERTVRALERDRRWAWFVTGVGALGVGLVLTVMIVEIEADDDLRAVGVTTVGTVVEVEPDTGFDAGSASVRFTVDGLTRARDVTLGGYADDYVAGDVVDVVYDPAAPDRFIIDDALYGPTWTGWLLVPSLLLAGAAPFGVTRVVRVGRARRQLARTGRVPPRRDSGADGLTGLLDW